MKNPCHFTAKLPAHAKVLEACFLNIQKCAERILKCVGRIAKSVRKNFRKKWKSVPKIFLQNPCILTGAGRI